ncbi:MAG: DUF4908 domain-containing protein [Alphaproteobacteria bacterium]
MFSPADECSTSALPGFALSFTALAAILTAATPSAAEPLSPLSAGLFGSPQPSSPSAEKFVTLGRGGFTLDRSGPRPLMRFDGDDEVMVLRASQGPRGDEFLKTDNGQLVLRVTSIGGVTVYTSANDNGAPAAVAGPARPLAAPGRR